MSPAVWFAAGLAAMIALTAAIAAGIRSAVVLDYGEDEGHVLYLN